MGGRVCEVGEGKEGGSMIIAGTVLGYGLKS